MVLIRTGWDQLWKANMAQPADQAQQRDNMEADFGEPGAGASIETFRPEMVAHPCQRVAVVRERDRIAFRKTLDPLAPRCQ